MTLFWAVLFNLLLYATAGAQSEIPGTPWRQLAPEERQERLRNGARRWSEMTPEQKDVAKQNYQRWQQLPPEQQQRFRERLDHFRQLPTEEQQRLRGTQRWFQSLPAERRHELKERWKNLSPEERRRFRREMQDAGQ